MSLVSTLTKPLKIIAPLKAAVDAFKTFEAEEKSSPAKTTVGKIADGVLTAAGETAAKTYVPVFGLVDKFTAHSASGMIRAAAGAAVTGIETAVTHKSDSFQKFMGGVETGKYGPVTKGVDGAVDWVAGKF